MLGCGQQFDLDRCPIPNSRQIVAGGSRSCSREAVMMTQFRISAGAAVCALERNLTSYLQQVLSYSSREGAASARFPDQANKFSDGPI